MKQKDKEEEEEKVKQKDKEEEEKRVKESEKDKEKKKIEKTKEEEDEKKKETEKKSFRFWKYRDEFRISIFHQSMSFIYNFFCYHLSVV